MAHFDCRGCWLIHSYQDMFDNGFGYLLWDAFWMCFFQPSVPATSLFVFLFFWGVGGGRQGTRRYFCLSSLVFAEDLLNYERAFGLFTSIKH